MKLISCHDESCSFGRGGSKVLTWVADRNVIDGRVSGMSRSNYRGIFVAAVLLIVGSAIAVAAIVWRLRQDAIGEAVHETSNIAAIIAEQVAHSTQSVEIVLDEVLSEVTRRGVTDPDTAAERLTERSAHDFLRHRLEIGRAHV